MSLLKTNRNKSKESLPPQPGQISTETLQHVVDEAAILNLFVTPPQPNHQKGHDVAIHNSTFNQLQIEMPWPTKDQGVRAVNRLGDRAGHLSHRLAAVPYTYKVLPGRQSPYEAFNREISQRFEFQKCEFSFGAAGSLECFGTGRTYPMIIGGRPRLAAAAIADITHASGVFQGLPGNLTFCGILTDDYAFCGHVILRIVDQEGRLRILRSRKKGSSGKTLDMGVSFLNFVGQKGAGKDQENTFSQRADGQPRGVNISTELKQARVGFTLQDEKLQADQLETGAVIGREIGFGPLPPPGTPPDGVLLRPALFEGVARYGFFDQSGHALGAITTNVTEGRRIDIRFQEVANEVGFRFGFFGPVVYGTGCFQGAQGLFYGASASFLTMPPGRHIVTHFYAAMLSDPNCKYRV